MEGSGLLPDDAKYVPFIAYKNRSRFLPLMHVFATVLADGKPKSPPDIWNSHHEMFSTGIFNFSRRFWDLLRKDTNALAYAVLDVRNCLSKMFIAPFSTFVSPQNVHTPVSTFNQDSETSLTRWRLLFCLVPSLPSLSTISCQQLAAPGTPNIQYMILHLPFTPPIPCFCLFFYISSSLLISFSPVIVRRPRWNR